MIQSESENQMKYLPFLLIAIILGGCSGMSARRTWLGNWKEAPVVKTHVTDTYNKNVVGFFTLKQHQVYWADELDNCDLELTFTNTTDKIISFNYQINFALNTHPRKFIRRGDNSHRRGSLYSGHWTYTNAVIRVQPNSTTSFGHISDRIVSIKDGGIYCRITNQVTYEE